MTVNPHALPPVASTATARYTPRPSAPPLAAAIPATDAPPAPSSRPAGLRDTAGHDDPRSVLLRLVSHDVALAAIGATEDDHERWVREGGGWPVRETPDGVRLADAADVLAAMPLIGGAA